MDETTELVTQSTSESASSLRGYAAAFDPLTITLPQLANIITMLGIGIMPDVYQQLPANLKSLFSPVYE